MPSRRPRVVVSRCLGFEACRWDGGIVAPGVAQMLLGHADVVTVCPEADAGMGVPRSPINLVRVGGSILAVQADTGRDFSGDLRRQARRTLASLGHVDAFILKARSPSCGLGTAKLLDAGGAVIGLASGIFACEAQRSHPGAVFLDEEQLAGLGLEGLLRLLGA